MGVTRSDIFTEEQNRLADLAKVLGHPARIAILQQVLRQNTCICGDLVNDIGLAQATISQHLKELKRVGLIKGRVEGTSVCYCIDEANWNQTAALIAQLFESVNSTKSCC